MITRALFGAVRRDYLDVFFALTKHFDVDVKATYGAAVGGTLLHDAAEKRAVCIAEHLLRSEDVDLRATNYFGKTALHLALSSNSTDMARMFLQCDARRAQARRAINLPCDLGKTPLMYALRVGTDFEIIRLMLSERSSDTSVIDHRGQCVLHYAAGSGLVDALSLLLE